MVCSKEPSSKENNYTIQENALLNNVMWVCNLWTVHEISYLIYIVLGNQSMSSLTDIVLLICSAIQYISFSPKIISLYRRATLEVKRQRPVSFGLFYLAG